MSAYFFYLQLIQQQLILDRMGCNESKASLPVAAPIPINTNGKGDQTMKKLKSKELELSKMEDEIKNYAKLQDKYKEEIKTISYQNQELKARNERVNRQKTEVQKKQKLVAAEKIKLERQFEELKEQLNKKKKKIEQLSEMKVKQSKNQNKMQVNVNEQQIKLVQSQNQALMRDMKKKEKELTAIQEQMKQIKLQFKFMEENQNKLKTQIQQFKKVLEKEQTAKNKVQLQNNKNIQNIKTLKRQLEQLKQKLKQKQLKDNHIKNEQPIIKQIQNPSLFVGDILNGQQQYRSYLIQIIQKNTRAQISRTQLIYRFDVLNTVNFHKYVDGKDQLVVIIKTKNNYFLGAWTQDCFQSNSPSTKNGIIFSLNNRKYYELVKKNTKAITYDDFYLIFGNSEIRLKSQQQKIFTNFGIANSCYNSRGDKVDALLGNLLPRQVEIEGYQIFQLTLI